MARALAITLALFAVVLALALARYAPPPARGVDASEERFSAARAREIQRRVVAGGETRWVGSEGNARARATIVAELERLGWQVETQSAMSCSFQCALVTNVVARLQGREPELPGVLLSTHYDSVPVSPGASDDGVGVAALLETARALTVGPRPRRNVVVLVSDGEEAGMLGARAFSRRHPLAAHLLYTVNVDARGSGGASLMFETSADNRALVELLAEHLERPMTTSLFFEIYKRMPNDTDFSITKTRALGVNFANIEGIEHYHTPLDTLENANVGTLQSHGDHVLGMTRAFAGADPPAVHGEAVWFDVLGFGIVRWPASAALSLALVALFGVLSHAWRFRAFDRGVVVFPLSLGLGLLAAVVVGWALHHAGAIAAPWVAHPYPVLTSLHAAAAAGVIAVAAWLVRKGATPRALWSGTWVGWGVVGVASAAMAPGTSYLFVAPTLVAAVAGFLPLAAACALPAAVVAVLAFALATGVYDVIGLVVPAVVTVTTILVTTTLAPMTLGRRSSIVRRAPIALAVLSLASAIVAVVVPAFSAAIPQRVNVVFRQEDGQARVFVDPSWVSAGWGAPPAAMVNALGHPAGQASALPWTRQATFAEVPAIDVKPPTIDVLSVDDRGGRRRVRVRFRSPRAAPTIAVLFPSDRAVDASVAGAVAVVRPVPGGQLLGLLAVPPEGVVVDLEAAAPAPIRTTILDRSWGVPPGTAAAVVRARPVEATTVQDGDVTVLVSTSSL